MSGLIRGSRPAPDPAKETRDIYAERAGRAYAAMQRLRHPTGVTAVTGCIARGPRAPVAARPRARRDARPRRGRDVPARRVRRGRRDRGAPGRPGALLGSREPRGPRVFVGCDRQPHGWRRLLRRQRVGRPRARPARADAPRVGLASDARAVRVRRRRLGRAGQRSSPRRSLLGPAGPGRGGEEPRPQHGLERTERRARPAPRRADATGPRRGGRRARECTAGSWRHSTRAATRGAGDRAVLGQAPG